MELPENDHLADGEILFPAHRRNDPSEHLDIEVPDEF
jgi:hypothetical protein